MARKRKLTASDERLILSLLQSGRTQASLALQFDVDQSTISRIAKRMKNAS